jgi:hypothetical protein
VAVYPAIRDRTLVQRIIFERLQFVTNCLLKKWLAADGLKKLTTKKQI